MADGEMSAADSNTSVPEKKSGDTFGHKDILLLISLYQKYEVFFSDTSYKKKVIWQMIASPLYIGLTKHSANPKQSTNFLPPLYLQGKLLR